VNTYPDALSMTEKTGVEWLSFVGSFLITRDSEYILSNDQLVDLYPSAQRLRLVSGWVSKPHQNKLSYNHESFLDLSTAYRLLSIRYTRINSAGRQCQRKNAHNFRSNFFLRVYISPSLLSPSKTIGMSMQPIQGLLKGGFLRHRFAFPLLSSPPDRVIVPKGNFEMIFSSFEKK
jgi:hypothetical protein